MCLESSNMRKNLPDPTLFINKTFPRLPNHKIDEHIGNGANGHVYRAYSSDTASSLAFKIIPVNNLATDEDAKKFLDEAKKANVLENQSVVKYHDVFYEPEDTRQYVVFVCDYVKGVSLDRYIEKSASDINVQFIETFLHTMFRLLYELKLRNFPHGDLHAGNVLVAKSKYDIDGRTTFRVTDFGVQQFSEQRTDESDYLSLARTLEQLLLCIDRRDCEGRDRFVFDVLVNDFLKRHLIETDTSADDFACNPQAMSGKLNSMDEEYQKAGKSLITTKLVTPFDYPNCEQIGNSHLLLKNLYSERLLGLSKIHERSNLVLTGPRGCGKTTVFRALSLEHLTSVQNDNPDDIDYIGIYYRCDDLYFSFPRYERPERPVALDIPMHFLIATLLSEALKHLSVWARKHFSEEFKKKEQTLTLGLWEILGLNQPDSPNANQIETLVNKLDKERKRAKTKQQFINVQTEPIENYFEPGIMIRAGQHIKSSFSFLAGRPFYFFIDDYSAPKITVDLQKNLNRLMMFRCSDIFFKFSTESPVSFARDDVDGKKFVEHREYELLNLGLQYLDDNSKLVIEFLKDLFRRRFQEVDGYPVRTLEELIGSMPRNENATARAFIDKSKTKKPIYYAGYETLAAMCSGDIHYMIRLVAKMVEDSGGQEVLATSKTNPKILPHVQAETIRASAGAFMESIRILPGKGPHLAKIVTAFGNVAHSYIRYKTSANESNNPPHQASRIEPYESLRLPETCQEFLNDLQRYSIFIEDPRGKSRRGNVVPRYYLRRYLIPHFRLTFSRRDSLQLENHEIITLLDDPDSFEKSMKTKLEKDVVHQTELNLNE